MLGRGIPQGDVAGEVGVSRRTVSDWLRRDDFAELVEAGAAAHANESPSVKTMRAVLEDAAHNAVTKDGFIDYPTRVRAAAALTRAEGFGAPPEPPAPEIEFFDDALADDEPAEADPAEFTEGEGVTDEQRAEWDALTWGDGWGAA